MSSNTSDHGAERQARTSTTFVQLVDTLVDDFDVIDLLTLLSSRSVELLGAEQAGILLADSTGHLRVMAASSEQIALLELFQVQNDEGPCLDCFRTGQLITEPDLTKSRSWPRFSAESVRAGYPSVCAVPLRLRAHILGCLNLFLDRPIALSSDDLELAQALADVASIAIMQDQAARDAAVREGQLEHALQSRVIIEQAKGMIAEYAQIDMDEAFTRLRSFARHHNRHLTEVAQSLVAGRLPISETTAGA